MSWKAWAAIAAGMLIVFLVLTYINRQRWVAQDVERQMQIAQLQKEAERYGQEAKAAADTVAAAKRSATSSQDALLEAEAELDTLRKKVRDRPSASSVEELRAQLAEADELIFKLEESLAFSQDTVTHLSLALDAAGEQATALEAQVAANEKAWTMERKRSETWQQQTKRGRVKTAFLAIGATAAGGLAGYGVGVAR